MEASNVPEQANQLLQAQEGRRQVALQPAVDDRSQNVADTSATSATSEGPAGHAEVEELQYNPDNAAKIAAAAEAESHNRQSRGKLKSALQRKMT